MRQPTGRMRSVSGQAAAKADATRDLTRSERPLHEYVAEVSERTDTRVGVPLPLGAYARGEGVNFAFFSRHASRVRLELFDHPEDATAARVIEMDPARNRTGDVWHVWIERIRPASCMPIAWTARINPRTAIVSISTSFSWIPSLPRFRGCPRGILHRHVDTTRRRRSKTWLSRSWTIPGRCRNAYLSTCPSSGMETSHPGIRGRRRSFTKRMFAALPFIPSRAWTIREPTEA